MTVNQKEQQKADKRAAALRDNLKKRKAFIKETKQEAPKKQDNYNAKA